MKGPANRHKLVVLRTWECPRCGKRQRTPGRVTHKACDCAAPGETVWMRIVAEGNAVRRLPPLS